MNAKNKIIALVMSVVICFGTVSSSFANDKERINNIQPLVVDGGVISAPMVATVVTLALATGVVINDDVDIYSIANAFYNHNKQIWDTVVLTFNSAVAFNKATQQLEIGKDFLDIFKNTFNDIKNTKITGSYLGIPIYEQGSEPSLDIAGFSACLPIPKNANDLKIGDFTFTVGSTNYMHGWYKNKIIGNQGLVNAHVYSSAMFLVDRGSNKYDVRFIREKSDGGYFIYHYGTITDALALPGFVDYNDSVFEGKDKLPVTLPKDLGDISSGSFTKDDVLNPPGDLAANDGVVSRPSINNPGFEIDDSISFPLVDSPSVDVPGVENPSIPNDSIWSTIKDFVISLVVPSDTFWTDVFTSFRDNLQSNFPMLDMSAFDSLLVNGKPFPNMFAFGGKIVDGDTINSIVDWLRPIVAGFVMLLLLFFNYRKLHKIIRNSDPYGSVAEKGCTSNVN